MDMDARFRHPFPALTREEAERSFEFWLQPKPLGLLATIHKADKRYVGRCGLYPHRDESDEVIAGEATLAFYLAPEYWNQGLATEAGRAFIEYGFRELGLKRIVAGASVKNIASNRVLKRIGMEWVRSGGVDSEGGPAWHEYAVAVG